LNDSEFVAEVRRHLIAIVKAVYKRYGINILDLPALYFSPGTNTLDEPPVNRLVLTGDSQCTQDEQHPQEHYPIG